MFDRINPGTQDVQKITGDFQNPPPLEKPIDPIASIYEPEKKQLDLVFFTLDQVQMTCILVHFVYHILINLDLWSSRWLFTMIQETA